MSKQMAKANGKGTHPGGRPSKLAPDLAEKFFGYIKNDVPVTRACIACGITLQSVQNWCKRGKKAGKGEYFEFFEQYTVARQEALIFPQLHWRNAMPDDWRACQAYLRVRDKENFAEQSESLSIAAENVLIISPQPCDTAEEWEQRVQRYLNNKGNGLGGNLSLAHKPSR